jgi:MerR family transcriptional regulator, repressor of the yfmOP operon
MGHRERITDKYIPLRMERATSAPAPAEGEYLQIGEVAERTGLTQRTLRYYEELQLLDPPSRMAGGFRLYSPADVARVEHIIRLKQLLGYSLAEIKSIVGVEEAHAAQAGAGSAGGVRRRLEQINELIANTSAQLELLGRKVSEMERLRGELGARLQDLERKRAALLAEHEGAQAHAASEYS